MRKAAQAGGGKRQVKVGEKMDVQKEFIERVNSSPKFYLSHGTRDDASKSNP